MKMNHPHHRPLVLEELGPNDVLLGRGTGPNEHIGNGRFRNLVAEELTLTSNQMFGKKEAHLEGKEKSELALRVLKAITAKGGRFVKKYTVKNHKGRQGKTNVYLEVPISVALEKAKQTIRYMLGIKHLDDSGPDHSLKYRTVSSKIRGVHATAASTGARGSKEQCMSIGHHESAQTLLEFSKGASTGVNQHQRSSSNVSCKAPTSSQSMSTGEVEKVLFDTVKSRNAVHPLKGDDKIPRKDELEFRHQPLDASAAASCSPFVLWPTHHALSGDALRSVLDSAMSSSSVVRSHHHHHQPLPNNNHERTSPELRGGLIHGRSNSFIDDSSQAIKIMSSHRLPYDDQLVATSSQSNYQSTHHTLDWVHLPSIQYRYDYYCSHLTRNPYPSSMIPSALLRKISAISMSKPLLQEEFETCHSAAAINDASRPLQHRVGH